MKFSIIVALTNNYVIGRLNSIPWFLPYDILWFKYHTLNKPVIMGRRTFESMFKRPLVGRFNIVLSQCLVFKKYSSNCIIVNTPEEAMWVIRKIFKNVSEVMIIGGEEIYNVFFPYVNRLYLTCIDINIYGDTFFFYKRDEWKMVFDKFCCLDGLNFFYSFKIFERI